MLSGHFYKGRIPNTDANARRDGRLLLVMACLYFIAIGAIMELTNPLGMTDFQETWNGARCLIVHRDPYLPDQLWAAYLRQGHRLPDDPVVAHSLQLIVSIGTNLPTALVLLVPLAFLSWKLAMLLWLAAITAVFLAGCWSVWNAGADSAPRFCGALIMLLAANSGLLLATGNMAGLTVGLAVIAAGCFLQDRFVPVGIVCLAVALLLKPHDAGPIWLYFFLAGGAQRKRSLQTLALAALFAAPALLWIYRIAPHWPQEYHANLVSVMSPGGRDYPGPHTAGGRGVGMIVSLQAALSLLRDDPRFYNPLVYLVCGVLFLIWSVKTLRVGYAPRRAWFALASMSALALLPVYHRTYDARLLLLTIPACAILWRQHGRVAWIALVLNIAAIVFTGDLLWIALFQFTGYAVSWVGLAMVPAPLILLALAIFYLAVYLRQPREEQIALAAPGL